MMPRRAVVLGLLCLAMIGGGCAKTTLTIRVDQYDEDPRVRMPMTPRKAHSLITDLHKLSAEATSATSTRVQLANDSSQIFQTAWRQLGGGDSRAKDLEKRRLAYLDALTTAHAAYQDDVEVAVRALRGYVDSYQTAFEAADKKRQERDAEAGESGGILGWGNTPDAGDEDVIKTIRVELVKDETAALDLVSDVVASYRTLGAIDTGFAVDWNALEFLLNAHLLTADTDGRLLYRKLGETLEGSIRVLARRAERLAGVSLSPSAQLRAAHTPTTVAGTSLALANEIETLRNDLPETATSRAALASLVTGSSRRFELVDRLQDAGDPVWRTVTDPANEGHWNEDFVKTWYYAEGDSSVVVVRDDPMRYRTQKAKNNPLALVQGQLEISRTLANAALSVAGAATGLPTGALASSTAGSSTAGSLGAATANDGLALRRAKAEAWADQRDTTLASLQRYLRSIARTLADTEDDQPKAVETQRRRLKAVLEGHKPLFQVPPE